MIGPGDVIREEVRGLSAYHVPAADGMIKLDAMENPYSIPVEIRREMAGFLSQAPLNRYPDASGESLKRILRRVAGIPDGLDILLGNGSDEIIQMIILACARNGAAIMAPSPTFAMYRQYALIAGLNYIGVPLRPDFSLDIAGFEAEIAKHRPAIIFLSYPNNPTGNLFDLQGMRRIVAAAPGLVVVDEAYHPFAGTTFLNEMGALPNVVLLRTLSKLGLAGIRLGFAAGRPEWMREFEKVRSPYNVNVLTQVVAAKVLEHVEVLDGQATLICSSRGQLMESLAGIAGVTVFPSQANFVLCRLPGATRVFEQLRSMGILVKCLHGSHPLLEDCLRITVGTPQENAAFLGGLRQLLGQG